jgi:hypothetical protein
MHPVNQSFSNTGAEKRKIRNSFTYPGTYPGRRFPHVWLSISVPGNLVFTIDVARIEKLCLFTGTRGVRWERAAKSIEKEWGLPITAVRIGRAQDWQDTYLHWESLCDQLATLTKVKSILGRALLIPATCDTPFVRREIRTRPATNNPTTDIMIIVSGSVTHKTYF